MTDADAIVVGGGPAGSTIAAALAEAGHRVLLLDKARFPRHKPCSDYINAGAVQLLDQMGILRTKRDFIALRDDRWFGDLVASKFRISQPVGVFPRLELPEEAA